MTYKDIIKAPQISIIIPVFNGEEYISYSIESIMRQTKKDWELIIVNDGSLDNTENICKKYMKQDPRIRYFEQDNKGVASARNFGLSKAKGRWITFLDADDEIAPFTLEVIDYAPKEIQAIMSGMTFDKKQWCLKRSGKLISSKDIQSGILNLAGFKRQYPDTNIIDDYNNWSSCSRFFLREMLIEHEVKYPVGIKYSEDLIFCMAVYNVIEAIWLNDSITYYYRDNSGSTTRNYRADLLENTDLVIEMMSKLIKDTDYKEQFSKFILYNIMSGFFGCYFSEQCVFEAKEIEKKIEALCERDVYRKALEYCDYRNLVNGKRNRIKCVFTLFFLKNRLYKAYVFAGKIIAKFI